MGESPCSISRILAPPPGTELRQPSGPLAVRPQSPNHWTTWELSVQFSHSVTSNSLQPHGLQHARVPCVSPTPRAGLNSCPSSRWCYKNISSVVPFSSCLQSFLALRSFPISEFFASGGQSTGALFSFSISPSKEYSGLISFRIDWFDLLAVQGTLKSLLQHHSSKAPIFWCSACFMAQLSHPYMTRGKTTALMLPKWCLCF